MTPIRTSHPEQARSVFRARTLTAQLLGAPRLRLLIALALAAALVPLASASGCSGSQRKSDEPEAWVEIRGQRIEVEVAEDPATQAKGLGDRDSLAWDRGMLFVYEEPAFYAFWMKGMRFSIDIVWLRKGRIVDLDVNVPFEPGGNGPTLRPSSLADAVLEVPAGYAMAHGWRIGDRVDFERGTPP